MRLIWEVSTQAAALSTVFYQSRASLRQRPSHANLRSTTHLRGSTSKPLALSDRSTSCSIQRPRHRRAPRSFAPV